MEDGTPFCKQCGAPQIRVALLATSVNMVYGYLGFVTFGQAAFFGLGAYTAGLLAVKLGMNFWLAAPLAMLPGAALGGAFSLLAAIVPYAIFGPAFLAGGAVAVILYRRHIKDRLPSAGAGAQVGAASGGFGFLFFAIPAIATLVYRPDELRQGMLDNLAQYVGRGYDPQKIQQVQDLLKSPQGLNFFVAFVLFILFLMFVVGSSIGGALYAACGRKRAHR